ncbi:MAG: ATP-binding protein [Oscillospiraceae bacterium]|nr:ATP-binding protein [Oscillospiraceae bacterium]
MKITDPRALSHLTAFYHLKELPLIHTLDKLLKAIDEEDEDWSELYCRAFFLLAREGQLSLGDCIADHLRYDESPYALAVAKAQASPLLIQAAAHDLARLESLLALDWAGLCRSVSPALPLWERGSLPSAEELNDFYRRSGCGQFARYKAFVWQDGSLIPVKEPDCIPPEEMLGYQRQREQVASNTRAMLAGHRVNNMLLYGVSGTGKSATVKSLLNLEGMENLRLIEVDKSDLAGIPELVRMLGHQPQKFILFIDDLAFDKDDRNYSLLKTILEGGVEPRPANVAVYATSNRRHLVRETFSDRLGDEIDATETIQEKTSLSERFGLRVIYHELTKPQFLDMIRELAQIRQVPIDQNVLMSLAVRWDARNPNRTPRSAVQFIDSLVAM